MITSGFYNSSEGNPGDRTYTAEQFSQIFDGLITDGVYAHIGDKFFIEANNNGSIDVRSGRAWINSVWVYNDSPVTVDLTDTPAGQLLSRWDVVFLKVDKSQAVRAATLEVRHGTESSYPVKPQVDNQNGEYALAYIERPAGSGTTILQSQIVYAIGSSEPGYTPWVTGILESIDINEQVARWESKFNEWYARIQSDSFIPRILEEGVDYGTTFPIVPTKGRLFFKKD